MSKCKKCKHLVMFDYKNRSYSCELGECEFDPEEQEPITKNDLGVDREDAVERLNALKHLIGYDKDSEIVKATQKSLDMAIKALGQEPKTGHWISRWYAGHDFHFHVCSECNEEFGCDMETGISIDNYRYCPNCGAKMAESEDKE